jgi:hypothetical protein
MEFIFLLALTFAVIIAADFSPLETGYNHNFEDITQENQQKKEKS